MQQKIIEFDKLNQKYNETKNKADLDVKSKFIRKLTLDTHKKVKGAQVDEADDFQLREMQLNNSIEKIHEVEKKLDEAKESQEKLKAQTSQEL